MSFTACIKTIKETTHADLALYRTRFDNRQPDPDQEISINTEKLSKEALLDLVSAAAKSKELKTGKAAQAILDVLDGKKDLKIPNFKAFEGMLQAFLRQNIKDGWIYNRKDDGHIYPELVTHIGTETPSRGTGVLRVWLKTISYSYNGSEGKMATTQNCYYFSPSDVARRHMVDALAAMDLFKETDALKKDYEEMMNHHKKVTSKSFSKQFRFSGTPTYERYDQRRTGNNIMKNRKVIHDLSSHECKTFQQFCDSDLFEKGAGSGEVPEHPVIYLFDLKSHTFYWGNCLDLKPHKYDASLREKLVLPETHKDLLDILTDDLDAFTEDIIEGKSSGNVILCKGLYGVGKTLTAEVYAELIKKPLYKVHSGALGTTAQQIQKSLELIFWRTLRWEAVLLLDEADVFVKKRGDNIEQNAIVAEFLRVLEYFTGLMFMTTNRPDDIDDAILSRCAAIIDYPKTQSAENTAKVWHVMASQHKKTLPDELVNQLIETFPDASGRDIKMLFRLALRVAGSKNPGALPDIETFRRCAMFRAITIKDTTKPA